MKGIVRLVVETMRTSSVSGFLASLCDPHRVGLMEAMRFGGATQRSTNSCFRANHRQFCWSHLRRQQLEQKRLMFQTAFGDAASWSNMRGLSTKSHAQNLHQIDPGTRSSTCCWCLVWRVWVAPLCWHSHMQGWVECAEPWQPRPPSSNAHSIININFKTYSPRLPTTIKLIGFTKSTRDFTLQKPVQTFSNGLGTLG